MLPQVMGKRLIEAQAYNISQEQLALNTRTDKRIIRPENCALHACSLSTPVKSRKSGCVFTPNATKPTTQHLPLHMHAWPLHMLKAFNGCVVSLTYQGTQLRTNLRTKLMNG